MHLAEHYLPPEGFFYSKSECPRFLPLFPLSYYCLSFTLVSKMNTNHEKYKMHLIDCSIRNQLPSHEKCKTDDRSVSSSWCLFQVTLWSTSLVFMPSLFSHYWGSLKITFSSWIYYIVLFLNMKKVPTFLFLQFFLLSGWTKLLSDPFHWNNVSSVYLFNFAAFAYFWPLT